MKSSLYLFLVFSLVFFTSCAPAENSSKNAKVVVLSGCGCGGSQQYENQTAVAFKDETGSDFTLLSEKIIGSVNEKRMFIPLYLESRNVETSGSTFSTSQPSFMFNLLRKIEKEKNIHIKNWRVEEKEYVIEAIWIDYEDILLPTQDTIQTSKTAEPIFTIRVKKGDSLHSLGLSEQQAEVFAKTYNLKYWRKDKKLIVQLKEGDLLTLKG